MIQSCRQSLSYLLGRLSPQLLRHLLDHLVGLCWRQSKLGAERLDRGDPAVEGPHEDQDPTRAQQRGEQCLRRKLLCLCRLGLRGAARVRCRRRAGPRRGPLTGRAADSAREDQARDEESKQQCADGNQTPVGVIGPNDPLIRRPFGRSRPSAAATRGLSRCAWRGTTRSQNADRVNSLCRARSQWCPDSSLCERPASRSGPAP